MHNSPFNPTYQNQNKESRIVAALERISEAFRVLLWKESKEYGLSPIQIQILIFIKYHSAEKRKVGFLANEFNMTKATVSDAVKALEQKKLIHKITENLDSRSYTIHLTQEGNSIVDKTSLFTAALQKPVDQLSETQKEVLLESLLELIFKLQKAGIVSPQRMCHSCRFYSLNSQQHFCGLLNSNLEVVKLRLDCPEHEACH